MGHPAHRVVRPKPGDSYGHLAPVRGAWPSSAIACGDQPRSSKTWATDRGRARSAWTRAQPRAGSDVFSGSAFPTGPTRATPGWRARDGARAAARGKRSAEDRAPPCTRHRTRDRAHASLRRESRGRGRIEDQSPRRDRAGDRRMPGRCATRCWKRAANSAGDAGHTRRLGALSSEHRSRAATRRSPLRSNRPGRARPRACPGGDRDRTTRPVRACLT